MTKLDEAKIEILAELEAKEYVINVEFDKSVCDEKPFGYKFYRLNIFHKNEDGEATFSAKGVYINAATGMWYLHPGGVSQKALVAKEIPPEPAEPVE